MQKALIVAYGRNGEIGAHGDLPWGRNLPGDLAQFKRRTTGGSIIMGRRTFESIGRKPLPNRENIVVSSTPTGVSGVLTALSLESAYALARYSIFIIGGARLYRAALPTVDVIYATEVDAVFPDADTFFPKLSSEWQEVEREHHEADEKNLYAFDFVEYKRVK
ncbi:dihydrofolate reductase [Candidatus Saccharibacteria bacterium]|nr:dihydrofolate reductase [Candidatus Saccharibacteria bacterium]